MKVLIVTGSRLWTDRGAVKAVILLERPDVVIHGEARGLDQIAAEWCEDLEIDALRVPGRWKRYNKSAGPIRNRRMAQWGCKLREAGNTIIVHAFPLPQSIGTVDCIAVMRDAGFDVIVH